MNQDKIEHIHDHFRWLKESMWNEHGVLDLSPHVEMLVVKDDDPSFEETHDLNIEEGISVYEKFLGDHGQVTTRTVMQAAVMMAKGHLVELGGRAQVAFIAMDAYMMHHSDEDDAVAHEGFNMKQDFTNNLHTRVRQEAMTKVYWRDAVGQVSWGSICTEYHVDDGGVLVWHEPRVTSSDDEDIAVGGFIHDYMMALFDDRGPADFFLDGRVES